MMDHLQPDSLATLAVDDDAATMDDREHLEHCARCTGELDVLRTVATRARNAQPDETSPAPPDDLWDRVVDELTATGDLPAAPVQPARPFWAQPWAAAAALVLVVIVAAAALLTVSSGGDDGGGDVVAEATLEPLADVDEGSAVLTAAGDRRSLTVDASMLPNTDGYYELWLLAADGTEMVSLGPLRDAESYDLPQAVDVDVFSVVDISREVADGDPTHSGDSVLRGGLEPTT